MTGVRVSLRALRPEDLELVYEHQRDPVAVDLVGLGSRDRPAFDEHWAKVMPDPTVIKQAILADGELVGAAMSFLEDDGRRFVGYWIGREHWGRGIVSQALPAFLALLGERPLFARVSPRNAGSLRVLEKSRFTVVERGGGAVLLRLG
jgi:RimJ/RimL family protein N-acetyltransferase